LIRNDLALALASTMVSSNTSQSYRKFLRRSRPQLWSPITQYIGRSFRRCPWRLKVVVGLVHLYWGELIWRKYMIAAVGWHVTTLQMKHRMALLPGFAI